MDTNCILFSRANETGSLSFFGRGEREDSENPVILGEGPREEENPANGKFLEIL